MPLESSIYIHFPFCKSKCFYCNFFSETLPKITHEDYINLLIKEALQRKKYLKDTIVKSIYFGGGTPSLFHPELISKFLSKLHEIFNVSENAEITIEVNPDDIVLDYVKSLKLKTKINRISIGIQSFNDNELKLINRRHTSAKAIEALEIISNYYENFSIDLIYGLPLQDLDSLNKSIETALNFMPKHISAYSLSVENHTPLFEMVNKNTINIPDEDMVVDFYLFIVKKLKKHYFEHYEISNYALPGFESKHNSAYWSGSKYLGLGAGAHSYNGLERRWNLPSLKDYQTNLESAENYFESEKISLTNEYNEYIMLGLRTAAGINLDFIKNYFGKEYYENSLSKLSTISGNHLVTNGSTYSLNEHGMLFADNYAVNFFKK